MAALKRILLDTLQDLRRNGLEKFRWLLQFTCFQKSLPQLPLYPWKSSYRVQKHRLVNWMVEVLGLQCLEVTREVFMDMNMTYLVPKLSDCSSASKGM